MNTIKSSAIVLALAFAGLSTSMAAAPSKTNGGIQKVREAKMEQLQEQETARQESAKRMSTIALDMGTKKLNTTSFHRRFKLGVISK